MRLLKLFGVFLLALSLVFPVYAFHTSSASINVTAPSSVESGKSFTVTYSIKYVGEKRGAEDICWPIPLSCPIGLFLRIKWVNTYYRVADTNSTDTSKDIYWPYPFDGSLFSKTVTVTLTAPNTPGEYTLYSELVVDERGGSDDTVASSSTPISVVAPKREEVSYQRTGEAVAPPAPPSTASSSCNVTITQIKVIPSNPYEGQNVDLVFNININCPSSERYGPFVKIHIKDAAGREHYCFRIGDQGYTECRPINEPNYYFKPGIYSKQVAITGLKFDKGIYKIYATVKYSKLRDTDPTLVSPYFLYSFTVSQREEALRQALPSESECSGRPILYMATWSDKNKAIKLSANVGEEAYALIYFKNAYSTCSYIGEVKVEIRKHVSNWFDEQIDTKVLYVKIPPNSDKVITVPFVPQKEGEYHYDVYWNDNKYGGSDVSKHHSKKVRGTSDVLVVGSAAAGALSPKEAKVTLLTAWFEKDGEKVFQVPDGTVVRACVNLTASAYIDGTVTINVKALSGIPQLGLIGDLSPDPVKHTYKTNVVLSPGNVTTVCTDTFVVRQSSAVHNEQYYIEVKFNDQNLGIYPESKDGLIIIPKTGKGNPLIKGQDELANLVVVHHGWYTTDGTQVSGTVPPGTYLVKAELLNSGTAPFSDVIIVTLKEDRDLQVDPTIDTCKVNVYLEPNETKNISCSFDLEDGKAYHYEISYDDTKLVSRGPSLTVRSAWNIFARLSDVYHYLLKGVLLNPWTIVGAVVILVIIILVIVTAPYWVPGVLSMIELWRTLSKK